MQAELERFERYLRNRHPGRSTAKHYMSDLAIFSRFVDDAAPAEVHATHIDGFVASQGGQGLQPATINRRLSAISSFYEFLIGEAEDEQLRNPVIWKRHSIRMGRHLPRDLTDSHITQLFAVIDQPRDRAMFELMLGAGLRVGEVVSAQLGDLHAPDSAGLVRLRVRGKGDQDRVVWFTAETARYVQNWLQERPPADHGHLFLNQRGAALTVSGVQYRLKQYCQQAGVQFTCHQLRHTYARRLVEHGMPIASLAKLLGHSDLQTTQRYIDGADPSLRQDFHQAMQALDQEVAPCYLESEETLPTLALPPAAPEARPDPQALVDGFSHLATELPDWLQQAIREHTVRRISRWPPHRAREQTQHHFGTLCRISRWLVPERGWQQLEQLQRRDLLAYVQARQAAGLKPSSIAAELTVFRAFWRDLLAQELVTTGSLLLVSVPTSGDHLPRYLTSTEYQRLEQVVREQTQAATPEDLFNRAWFYLLAHAGLRRSEVRNLRLADCDLHSGRLRVQSGKGDRDRVVPMTAQLMRTLQDYLVVREAAPTDHLLTYRGTAVRLHLIANRLGRWGKLAQIDRLTPHRLRHTLATFLINQGMPITSLQKFLGHQDINDTLIYARVYDETVRKQFAAAMAGVEAIAVHDWPVPIAQPVPADAT